MLTFPTETTDVRKPKFDKLLRPRNSLLVILIEAIYYSFFLTSSVDEDFVN
jgi:hypothetical protein